MQGQPPRRAQQLPHQAVGDVQGADAELVWRQVVAAQFKIQDISCKWYMMFYLKRLAPDTFNVSVVGSSCTALPGLERRAAWARGWPR